MALEKGTELAGYRIEGILGQGGMGVVYEATQLSLDRTVALKLLAQNLSDDPAFRERFRREGLLQAAIDHPNIVTVYEAGDTDQGLFLAMRLVRGPNLKDMVLARELDAGRTLRILAPIADALDTAHNQGLIHRDIKPQNILVSGRDHAYLADFGLTKAPGEKSLTKTGQFVGTLDYISPEQIRGKPASAASDIYALAAVLYECLTGVVPYPKDSEAAVLYAHMSDEPPSVTDARPDLPAELDAVVRKAMSKEPEDRYTSANELMRAAEEAFSRKTRAAMTPPPPVEGPEDIGIREAEVKVSTREAQAQDSDELATQVGARAATPVPETVAAAPAAGATTAAAVPGATRMGRDADTATLQPTGERAGAARVAPALLAVAAVAAIAAAVGGFVAGHSGSSSSSAVPANNSSASVGPVTLTFPDNYQRSAGKKIPGYAFTNAIWIAPKSGGSGSIVAGTASASTPTLLPQGFATKLAGGAPKPEPVKLGKYQAYRYRGLKPKGSGNVYTVYAAPTSAGVATVACQAPAAQAQAFADQCERIASTLTLSGAKAYTLGVPAWYSSGITAALKKLQVQRQAALAKLKSAKTPGAQAAAARQAAAAYANAAKSHPRNVPPQIAKADGAILAALHAGQKAYSTLAAGAAADDGGRWGKGKSQVGKADAALKKALAQLSNQPQ